MDFRDFFEQQAGYDAPFDHEVETLSKLQSLDPIAQVKLDISLHNKAIGKQQFGPEGSVALQQDIPLKQKVIQIFAGQITDPKEIQSVAQQLKNVDKQTHLIYLDQPPNENTGSHVWHKTWAQVYNNWISHIILSHD